MCVCVCVCVVCVALTFGCLPTETTHKQFPAETDMMSVCVCVCVCVCVDLPWFILCSFISHDNA